MSDNCIVRTRASRYWATFGQSNWINPINRIRRIYIDIQLTRKPNRILADKPPHLRIILPIPVVVQPGFHIEVLALKAQRIAYIRTLGGVATLLLGQSPSPVDPAPSDVAMLVG